MSTYDEVPYRAAAHDVAHPVRIATVAHLRGLSPPDLGGLRVLELGCGRGRHLVALAAQLPEAHFVGLDVSEVQIADARALAWRAGVTNLELQCQDLATATDLGTFDVIVAHGVFSWVPRETQDALLALVASQLTERGLAYISYNTLPGWHLRRGARDLMRLHVDPFDDPAEKVAEARMMLRFAADSLQQSDSPWARFLRSEAELVERAPDWYLLHDHLGEHTEPLYFEAFATRAAAAGLAYVGEAESDQLVRYKLSPDKAAVVEQLADDPIRHEQLLDFIGNRPFRCTVLCRAGREPAAHPDPTRVADLFVVGRLETDGAVRVDDDSVASYVSADGKGFRSAVPAVKAALAEVTAAWPQAVSFEALREAVTAVLGEAPAALVLEQNLLAAHHHGLLDLTLLPPPLVGSVSERPRGCPAAQAEVLVGEERVTSRFLRPIPLDELGKAVLVLADGRTRSEILDELFTATSAGTVRAESRKVREQRHAVVGSAVDRWLARFAELGLLVG